MPRSFLKFLLVVLALSVLFACGGPPKKPSPPEKTSPMVVAKGTKTTDLPKPGVEAKAPPRPETIDEYIARMMREKRAAKPAMKPVAKPVKPAPKPVAKPVKPAPKPVAKPVKPAPKPAPKETLAEKRLRELAERKKVDMALRDRLVDYYLTLAEGKMKDLRYEEAEYWLLKALEQDADNAKALALLQRARAALGKRSGEIVSAKEELRKLHSVKQAEALTLANAHFNNGKRFFHDKQYARAIDAFENVLSIIEHSPYGVDWGTLPQETEQFLFQAKRLKEKADEAAARSAAEAALERVKNEEMRRKAEAEQRVAKLLTQGIEAFENERFELAEQLAEQVLAVDSMNPRARELRNEAVRARHRKTGDELLRAQKERFREWRLDIEKTTVPWSSRPLQWPSQREWDRVNRRAAALTDYGAGTTLSPRDQALKNRLNEEKTNFQFESATLADALDYIRQVNNINIVVDDKVKDDIEGQQVTLSVSDLQLGSALELLLKFAGAEYTYVLRNGVVFITNQQGARGEPVLRVFNVGDLTIKLTNFVAPNLILKPTSAEMDENAPPFGKAEEGEALLGSGAEELMELIQNNIGGDSWDEDQYNIQVSGTDKIVVTHTPEVQAQIARFLDDLRKFAGLVVTIETRFLTVNDDFLQDIGVDIRGLGGEKGPLVNLDDVTAGLEDLASAGYDNGNPGLPVASASHPSAGVFFNQNGDGDYKGRNENIFDRALGRVLSPLGGAIIQYTFLDDTDVSLILRAVEKSRNARLLQAPSLTVYNTQRANITLVNQLSFIQDFDVEVAQTAFIADPIVGIIQDGLALDVRPTISNDRKYITLELQPTIATLLRPIPTFQTSLGALTTPVTIQIPEMVIQKSQTTVRLPDNGSLVIGGLKNINMVDLQSEVPFLAKIPILNFFFSRKGSSKEVENLMVIVTARITNLVEEEQRFRMPYLRK